MSEKKQKHAICFFGTYESTFPRTITLKEACRQLNIKIIECNVPFWELKREKLEFFSLQSMIRIFFQLTFIYIRLALRYIDSENHDAVIVGYNGYFDMPIARLLTKIRKKPLIYTPVFPLYETSVEDRKYVNKTSIKSKAIHLVDEISCRLADLIIIETENYLNYYCQEFNIPREKYFKIPLGADESNYTPRLQEAQNLDSNQLRVLFYGKFIPLQGIPYIVEAAKLLENKREIQFEIIGSGQLSENIRNMARKLNIKNASFIEWVNYGKLPKHIQKADVCLGIFGTTHKAQRGIPIKVYESLAMKKPVITGDSPAAREVFTHKVNSILCEMGNPKAIAESILLLKNDKKLRENIAEAGFRLYQDLFSSKQIATEFEHALDKISD
ncbi:MAG: glycosyltransferase family 4 protein [Candidatus Aminicenantes bacterium]|nr:MAG: glycosyltransferase family 4 protein [Candidatus Aminicenantes bacterium]